MAPAWNLKQAKDRLSAIVGRALAGEPQEIFRRGDPAVVVIAKSALATSSRGTLLEILTKYPDLDFDLPERSD